MTHSRIFVPAALLVALALPACGGGDTPTTPTTPSTGNPAPVQNAGQDADLDSLFGAATSQILTAARAQRGTLSQAADAALGGEESLAAVVPLEAFGAGTPSPLGAARAIAAGPMQPLPIRFRDTKSESVGNGKEATSITTTKELDATLVDGTLSVVSVVRHVSRPLPGPDAAYPGSSLVTETRSQFDVAVCPDAAGRSTGRWSSTDRTWSTLNDATALAGPERWDMVREVTAEGTTAVRVGDDAEITGYDADIAVAMRKARSERNRPMDRRGTAHLVLSNVAPSSLAGYKGDAMYLEQTGDWDLLHTLGIGPQEFHAGFTGRVRAAYSRARAVWRSGACIEVIPARGSAGGTAAPNAVITLGPEARHRRDGSTVAPATLDAEPSNGSIAAPRTGVAHPATFRFTMPATGGARVAFTATSRRGIGFGEVAFTPETSSGRIDYEASSSYALSGTDAYGQTVSGGMSGSERVASTFRLEFERQYADGSRQYRVLADNHVTMTGRGEMTGTRGGHSVTFSMALDGDAVSHNPAGPNDPPLVNGRMLAADQLMPSADAGQVRFYTRNGGLMYELRLRIGQIAPNFTWTRRSRIDCPETGGGAGIVTSTYTNSTHSTAVVVDDPRNCYRNPERPTNSGDPWTFGFIATDWSAIDPLTESNAMVTGRVDPASTSRVLTGERAGSFNTCERVILFDPVQLGRFARSNAHFPVAIPLHDRGVCQMSYAIRWSIPLPAEIAAAR